MVKFICRLVYDFQVGTFGSFGGKVQVEMRHSRGVGARQGGHATGSRLQEMSSERSEGNDDAKAGKYV